MQERSFVRLPSPRKQTLDHSSTQGFTLVEMLVVAPLVLLVIAVLISAMVSMVGSALITNARTTIAYDIQDAFSRIEDDARISTGFMDSFSTLATPQGRDGGAAPFSTSNGDLIFTQQATENSPYQTIRKLVYYKNQPNDCSADTAGNRPLMTRVVYFTLANPDGSKTLWRRVLVDEWNQSATPDTNTVCSKPWQRDTFPRNKVTASATKTYDERILDDVTTATSTYYDVTGNITTDPTKANTIKFTLAATKKVAGKTLTQQSDVEVSRINEAIN